MRRQEEIQQGRQYELRSRIERLDRNMTAWRRAERIRAYAKAVAVRLLERGPIGPYSDAAKWLAWAQRTRIQSIRCAALFKSRRRSSGSDRGARRKEQELTHAKSSFQAAP